MIYAVCGVGPRTGTTFVMEQLHKARLPVYWTSWIKNEGAGFDLFPDELPSLRNVIAKVFPPFLRFGNIGRVVLLRRDREDQIRSIKQQAEREGLSHVNADRLIALHELSASKIEVPVMDVRTENLSDSVDEIIEWMSVPFGSK